MPDTRENFIGNCKQRDRWVLRELNFETTRMTVRSDGGGKRGKRSRNGSSLPLVGEGEVFRLSGPVPCI